MTLTLPTRPDQDAGLRPVPWRRMAWVTWRQHRIPLAGVAALLGALAIYLWLAGSTLHHAYAAVIACHPADSLACTNLTSDFTSHYDHTATFVPALLQAVPALIGAFVGAPVLARELETGTFRYTWTQSFGRWRWAIAKLVPLAIVVTAAAGLFSQLFSWYYRPLIADGQSSPLSSLVFDLRGIAFPAWTLVAFGIAAMAGILIRRVLPAIVTALAAYASLASATGLFLRQHYLTPMVTHQLHLPASAWIMNQWWTKAGAIAFGGRPSTNLLQQDCPPSAIGPGKPSSQAIAGCLGRHGYTQWTRYQPGSRFWPFQFIETGWLLALSATLIALAVWLTHHRAA